MAFPIEQAEARFFNLQGAQAEPKPPQQMESNSRDYLIQTLAYRYEGREILCDSEDRVELLHEDSQMVVGAKRGATGIMAYTYPYRQTPNHSEMLADLHRINQWRFSAWAPHGVEAVYDKDPNFYYDPRLNQFGFLCREEYAVDVPLRVFRMEKYGAGGPRRYIYRTGSLDPVLYALTLARFSVDIPILSRPYATSHGMVLSAPWHPTRFPAGEAAELAIVHDIALGSEITKEFFWPSPGLRFPTASQVIEELEAAWGEPTEKKSERPYETGVSELTPPNLLPVDIYVQGNLRFGV